MPNNINRRCFLSSIGAIIGGLLTRMSGFTTSTLNDRPILQLGGEDFIPTGFHDLDEIMLGFKPGELTVIAGHEGIGKTAFALNLVRNIAIKEGIPVGMFSLDLTREIVIIRLLYIGAKVDNHLVRTDNLNKHQWKKLVHESEKLMASFLYLHDNILSLKEIKDTARKLRNEKNIQFIIIDYLQLIQPYGYTGNHFQEMASILSSLKDLAQELNIPTIVIFQLPEKEESCSDYRPTVTDFQEGNVIEQISDMILFVHRPWVYTLKEEDRNVAEIIIAKNRKGCTGTVLMRFIGHYHQFEDFS